MGSEITKQNGNIAFCEDTHNYWDVINPDRKFISVTTLIHSYSQPFNGEFWSSYKALEKLLPADIWKEEKKALLKTNKFNYALIELHGIDPKVFKQTKQTILDEWAETNRISCERGTAIHADFENSFYKAGKSVSLSTFGIQGTYECRKNYNELDLQYGVYPEYLISRVSDDGILCLAGQIDLLIKDGNDIIIGDFKTNAKINTKGFFDGASKAETKMKYPLTTLGDCNYSHYNLQLSTYAWMLQKINPDFNIKDLFLYHIDHENNTKIYHLPYLKHEVELMLAHYKKKRIREIQREQFKPIEY